MSEAMVPARAPGRWRRRVHDVLEVTRDEDAVGRTVDGLILGLVVLNVAAVILESIPRIHAAYELAFARFEVFSLAVFGAEYLLRLWSSVEDPRFGPGWRGRLRWVGSGMAVVDLLAVLPSFLGADLRTLRAVRLVRLARVGKLARYSASLQSFGRVFAAKREMLGASLFLVLLLHLFASSALYVAEHEAQPERFGSIPDAMWWGMTTLTTVGYGDVVPVTAPGKLLASIAAVLGVGLFALPAGILAAGFVEEISRARSAPRRCPHCGGEISPG